MDLENMTDEQLMALYQQEKAKIEAPGVGGGAAGSKAYFTQYGKKAADFDAEELSSSRQMRNNAADLISGAENVNNLYGKYNDLTGPLFDQARDLNRINPLGDKDRVAAMNLFAQQSSQGVLENVRKLPGPLSEKELAFLQQTTYDRHATPEENKAIAAQRAALGRKLDAYAQEQQKWINRYGSTRVRDEQGYSFEDRWAGWGSKRNWNVAPSNAAKTNASKAPTKTASGATVSNW